MDTIPRVPGIYQIRCLVTNEVYVGGTTNLQQRWYQHRWNLRKGAHTSHRLQQAWTRYGEQSFLFEVVELLTIRDDIGAREEFWVQSTKANAEGFGFNARPTASTNAGIKHSEADRKHQSERRKGISATPYAYERCAAVVSKEYIVTSPQGESFHIKNLRRFCIEHGLRYKHMHEVLRGKRHYCAGWMCKRLE